MPRPPDESDNPNFFATCSGIAATMDGDLILKGWPAMGGARSRWERSSQSTRTTVQPNSQMTDNGCSRHRSH
jgi:hypothetical protein